MDSTVSDWRLAAAVDSIFFATMATGADLGEGISGLSTERGRFFVIGDSACSASHILIMSIVRLPGVTIGEGLRFTHSQTLTALTATELFAILMQLSHTILYDLSLSKKSNGVCLSEKLLKGSQVLEDGG